MPETLLNSFVAVLFFFSLLKSLHVQRSLIGQLVSEMCVSQ